ncbi:hypothetical protein SLEP1_g59984, partial [Rubroshorea leprosula]
SLCWVEHRSLDNEIGLDPPGIRVRPVSRPVAVNYFAPGFMCAKAWRGKNRFNPSGIHTYIREYPHAPPANLLGGRGTQSSAHVDIMGNCALIEDIKRVAAVATGEDSVEIESIPTFLNGQKD